MNQYSEMKRQAEALLSQMDRGKDFIIGSVSDRLTKAADAHPQDTVIRAVARVIERMSRQDPTRLICQAEIDEVYQQLIGLNRSGTRFREVLGDLLISKAPEPVRSGKQYAEAHRDPLAEAISEIDPAVTEGLGQIFEPREDRYDPNMAAEIRDKVGMELKTLGFDSRIRLAGGNTRHLVFSADIRTRRGNSRVYIPAEAASGRFPSVFLSNDRFLPLTSKNLREHLEVSAGRKELPPSIPAVLASLDALVGQARKRASEEDVAKVSNMLPHSDGTGNLASSPLYADLRENEVRDVRIPRAEVPEPLRALTSEIEESVTEAGVGYPQAAVRLAKRTLHAELAAMGFRGSQVRIASGTADGLICEAILNTPKGKVAIEVPIEMRNDQPLMPSVFAQGDFCDDFSEAKLKEFVQRDPPTVAVAVRRDSPLLGSSMRELKDAMIKAVAQGDYKACEDVMEVVAERWPDNYKEALIAYKQLLRHAGTMREAHSDIQCSKVIRSSNSIHPICGHLMVPIHKVVQDEHGRCHLASRHHSRENQDDGSAFFSNAKVLVGD